MVAHWISQCVGWAPRGARLFGSGVVRVEHLVAAVGARWARGGGGVGVGVGEAQVSVRVRALELVGVDVRAVEPVHERPAECAPELRAGVQRAAHEAARRAAADAPECARTRRHQQRAHQTQRSLQRVARVAYPLAALLATKDIVLVSYKNRINYTINTSRVIHSYQIKNLRKREKESN